MYMLMMGSNTPMASPMFPGWFLGAAMPPQVPDAPDLSDCLGKLNG
jgi:hypothetical protein